jgi:hypothetical protein
VLLWLKVLCFCSLSAAFAISYSGEISHSHFLTCAAGLTYVEDLNQQLFFSKKKDQEQDQDQNKEQKKAKA